MAPRTNANMVRLDAHITLSLVRTARMGHSPIHRRPNLLGMCPQRTRPMVSRARLPFGLTFSRLATGQICVKGFETGIDCADVTIRQQEDVLPVEAAGRSGESWLRHNRNFRDSRSRQILAR